jgi:arsenite methyltransferase
MTMARNRTQQIKEIVKAEYAQVAREAASGRSSCCGTERLRQASNPMTANLYDPGQTTGLPKETVATSLGCGNPTLLTELNPGETVLDLGSGGGLDVLLSAKRVWPTGKAYGLDMTEEMLALARANRQKSGIPNAEFLKGEIEAIPLPDNSVDVVISNCVINLSPEKRRALREAFRVLRPGGRLAISDIVVRDRLPAEARISMELWIGCVSGAMEEQEYRDTLAEAGFVDVQVEPTRVYEMRDVKEFLAGTGLDADRTASQLAGKVMSAFVRGRKPLEQAALSDRQSASH